MSLSVAHGPPEKLKTLHPAYFALVMATGIVALALNLQGAVGIGRMLFWLNLAQFVALVIAFSLRARRYSDQFVHDMSSHARGCGYFTWVAAPGVMGAQAVLQLDNLVLALAFWALTASFWVLTTYGVFTAIMVRKKKPKIADGLNGGWLLSVVATQSLAILTALLARTEIWGDGTQIMLFVALALWLGGGILYIWVMTLIFLRYMFLRMSLGDLTPPYWISMGAVAISTLAGATLVQQADLSPVISELVLFMKGLTLLFWSVGTWWIPMLIVLGVWRHILCSVPLAYDPLYWGAVFPLGMYSVCTIRLSEVLPVSYLVPIGTGFALIAAFAWIVTFLAMLETLLRSAR